MKNLRPLLVTAIMAVSMVSLSAVEKELPSPERPLIAKQIEAFLMCENSLQTEGLPRDVKNLIFDNLIHLSTNINMNTRNLQVDRPTTDEKLLLLVRKSPFARNLDLSFCDIISGKGIANACKELFFLNTLALEGCDQITGSDLVAIVKECPNIVSLNISGCNKISGAKFQTAIDKCSKISSMSLLSCPEIPATVILDIVKRRPDFISIGLGCSQKGQSSKIAEIAKASSLKTLFSLSIGKKMKGQKLLNVVKDIPNLVSLRLSELVVISSSELLTLMEGCSALTELTLPHASTIFHGIMPQIKKTYPKLTINEPSLYLQRPSHLFYNYGY